MSCHAQPEQARAADAAGKSEILAQSAADYPKGPTPPRGGANEVSSGASCQAAS